MGHLKIDFSSADRAVSELFRYQIDTFSNVVCRSKVVFPRNSVCHGESTLVKNKPNRL